MRKRLWAGALAVLLLAAAGCQAPDRSKREPRGEKPVEGGVLRLGLSTPPAGLFRPLTHEDPGDDAVERLLFSGLLRPDRDLRPVCDLCEQYTVSEDQRSLTFRLRANVVWHDGAPFTAKDVVSTLHTILHPDYQGSRAPRLAALLGVQHLLDDRDAAARLQAEGKLDAAAVRARRLKGWSEWLAGPGSQAIVAVDEHTVMLTLSQPYGPLLHELTLPVAPAHTTATVGTGPYKLVEYRKGEAVRLARHEAYHLGRPWIPAVELTVVKPGEGLKAISEGRLDVAPLSPDEARMASEASGIGLVRRPEPGYQYLGLNHDRPEFADLRVRQALLYALDREAMVAELFQGVGTVVNTHLLNGSWALGSASLEPYRYDAGRAAALLAEAGWAEKDAAGYLIKAGKRFRFTLKYPQGHPIRTKTAGMVQAQLKAVGIKVDLEPVPFEQLVKEVFGERRAEAWLLGWELTGEPDPGPVFTPDNKWGRATGWSNLESEQLIRRGRGWMAPEKRAEVYAAWAKLVNRELPHLFLYAGSQVEAYRADRLRGVSPDLRALPANVWEWWIPAESQG